MTTKNRRAVGTLGVAAVVAVLAVSMIAMNFTTQPIQAEAANKFGTTYSTTTFLTDMSGSDLPAIIIEYENKAVDKQNIFSTMITECTTQTLVKASGGKNKDSSSDSASVGAYVWFTVSWIHGEHHLVSPSGLINGTVWEEKTETVPLENFWHICGQQMDLNVNLNPLIVKCTADQAAAGLCIEGQLVFLCDVDDSIPEEECDQYVEIFLKNWGTHSAGTFIKDVPHGEYYVSVWGDSDIDLSDNVDPDDKTKVIIGKKVIISQPVNIDKSE